MPYPEMLVAPMREDLNRVGFTEMRTADAVDAMMGGERRTTLLAVNSVCGCAAGALRPAVALSMEHDKLPELRFSVFAGQDLEATERARDYITGYPPSSPSLALFKDGDIVFMMERHQVEGYSPDQIAESLKAAYDEHC